MIVDKIWLAPAKLNLMLRIIGQREDGYHLLQTTFQFLDYSDELTFDVRQDGEIKRTDQIQGVVLTDDLIYRAAIALKIKTGCLLGADLSLKKKLPIGGGLGGGSSNAATTLVALNQLWQLNLSTTELADIGLKLGADVPVFVQGFAAWAEGIGEKLSPINPPECWFLVVIPDCSVSTKKVFSNSGLTKDSSAKKISDFPDGRGRNDCQKVVLETYPKVANAFNWLNQFAKTTLTGTGGCVFASFKSKAKAFDVIEQLPQNLSAFVAQGKNKSPLYGD